MCVCAQLCLPFCSPLDCNLPGSSVHGIFQTRLQEWVAISSSEGSSQLRDQTCISYVSCIGRRPLCHLGRGIRSGGSVQFSHSVVSDSLQLHGLQHARPPCPSPTPRAYSNSWLSRWCHPTISFSVLPSTSHLQSFPASGSFQMSQFFTSGDQSIGISASVSVLPMNIQDRFPLG